MCAQWRWRRRMDRYRQAGVCSGSGRCQGVEDDAGAVQACGNFLPTQKLPVTPSCLPTACPACLSLTALPWECCMPFHMLAADSDPTPLHCTLKSVFPLPSWRPLPAMPQQRGMGQCFPVFPAFPVEVFMSQKCLIRGE